MRSWTRPLLVMAMALGLGAVPGLGARDVDAQAAQLLPNLTPLQASELRTEVVGAETYLRFTTTSWNNGAGPLELLPGAVDTGAGKQKVIQRIYLSGGGSTDVDVNAWFDYHPAHNHIHVNDYAKYELLPAGSSGPPARAGSKTTFCIMDTTRMNTRLPGAPKKAVYRTCNALKQGMSVGWGDQYRYYLEGQSIRTTGLTGEYDLRITVDPEGHFLELNDGDNVSTRRISLANGRLQ